MELPECLAASRQRAEAIARRLWSIEGRAVEPLSGGITNANYKVTLPDGSRYVVRVFGGETNLLLINREVEETATRIAASLGLGPAIIADLRDERALVLEFIEGSPITPQEMARPGALRRVADALRKLHMGPPLPGVFDPFRVADAYYETARRCGVGPEQTEDYRWARSLAERIKSAVQFDISSSCHCDLLNGNFLDDGTIRIWRSAANCPSGPRPDRKSLLTAF